MQIDLKNKEQRPMNDHKQEMQAMRDELRELEGEGVFRDIPDGYVDSLTDQEVRERVADLRAMEDDAAED